MLNYQRVSIYIMGRVKASAVASAWYRLTLDGSVAFTQCPAVHFPEKFCYKSGV